MVEKIAGLSRQRIRRTIGLDGATMRAVDRTLVMLLGIGEQRA
jgi:hypothetical protein